MSRFHLKITHHTRNLEDITLNGEKKKSIKAKAEMTEMLELSDKAFKVAMLKCFNKQLQTLWKQIKT